MVVRSYKPLFWQCIKWIHISKYIDIQKSRTYKAFINKKNKNSSFFRLLSRETSPVAILFAIKNSLFILNLRYNDFELGYLLFCYINVLNLDIGFFYYYRNRKKSNSIKRSQAFGAKVRSQIIISLLESYLFYLRYIISRSSFKLLNQNPIVVVNSVSEFDTYKYYLFVDIKRYLGSTFLYTCLTKSVFFKIIENILCKFLDIGYLNNWLNYFTVSKGLLFKENDRLLKKIHEIVLLSIYYELLTMFDFDLKDKCHKNNIIGFYDNNCIWIYSSNNDSLILLRKIVILFLSSIFTSEQLGLLKVFSNLSKGILANLHVSGIKITLSFFYSIIQPSLSYQFILMKQVSLILSNSKSIALFLINIRLNMLYFLWLNALPEQLNYKVLGLLDYFIVLKLRALYRPITYCSSLMIQTSKQYYIKYKLRTVLKKEYLYYYQALYSNHYYNSYFLVKLVWIYLLKCKRV